MTAAVPGPRFRDQLAEALRNVAHRCIRFPCVSCQVVSDEDFAATVWATTVHEHTVTEVQADVIAIADALLPVIAAEVEARVQAAAGQQAAELRRVEALATTWECFGSRYTLTAGLAAEELRAALAQPAPQEPT